VSEEDFIAVYTDTVTVSGLAPATHRPMGVEVTQKSYGWSYSYAQDFVLFDFEIKNIGVPGREPRPLDDVWLGVYIDGDCLGPNTELHDGAQDDITRPTSMRPVTL
jgi:heme/copper-type cytochrome/quinol oxidase subunit 2